MNRGLSGVGLTRKEWTAIQHAKAGDHLRDDWPDFAHDALAPYEPPFDTCDREDDMRQAYEFFARSAK